MGILLRSLAEAVTAVPRVVWRAAPAAHLATLAREVVSGAPFRAPSLKGRVVRWMASSVQFRGLDFSYDSSALFEGLSLELSAGDRAVVVGENGVGKSTLLKLAAGELDAEEERVIVKGSIGYLPQSFEEMLDHTVIEYLIQATGSEALSALLMRRELEDPEVWMREFNALGGHRLLRDLHLLGIDEVDFDRFFGDLSGGEKVKVHLASLAASPRDVLLLDEPTNHLDGRGVAWLERYLRGHPGIVMMTTHDRMLIDRTATQILEISPVNGRLTSFRGGYTKYLAQIEQNRLRLQQERKRQESELKAVSAKLQGAKAKAKRQVHRRGNERDKLSFNAHGERKQRSTARASEQLQHRVEQLQDELVHVPKKRGAMTIQMDGAHLGTQAVVELEGVSRAVEGRPLFSDLSFSVRPAERLIIQGKNGSGKTTLLQMIAGQIASDRGRVVISSVSHIGFLDQEQTSLDLSLSPRELLMKDEEILLSESEIIGRLTRFGIYQKEALFRPLYTLSVGFRRKVQLAQILLKRCDILLLDEPTNHLDLPSVEHIEAELLRFPGPVIAVTHDRYFRRKVGTHLLDLEDYSR